MHSRKKRPGKEFGYTVFYKITRYNREPWVGTLLTEKVHSKGANSEGGVETALYDDENSLIP